MTYTRLARRLKANGAVDEHTYNNMVSITHPPDRAIFLLALCNGLLEQKIALSDMIQEHMSKV